MDWRAIVREVMCIWRIPSDPMSGNDTGSMGPPRSRSHGVSLTDLARWILHALRHSRAMPYLFVARRSPRREIIAYDLDRWVTATGLRESGPATWPDDFLELLVRYPEFRNLVGHRVRPTGSLTDRLVLWIAERCLPPLDSLFLATDEIGPGLFIHHGFSTIVAAVSIGRDCWINQQVTIGYTGKGKAPVIGDGVGIAAGAIVIGPVTVGDGAVVGAGAVVVNDVPPGSTVVGVAARVVREHRNGADASNGANHT